MVSTEEQNRIELESLYERSAGQILLIQRELDMMRHTPTHNLLENYRTRFLDTIEKDILRLKGFVSEIKELNKG